MDALQTAIQETFPEPNRRLLQRYVGAPSIYVYLHKKREYILKSGLLYLVIFMFRNVIRIFLSMIFSYGLLLVKVPVILLGELCNFSKPNTVNKLFIIMLLN